MAKHDSEDLFNRSSAPDDHEKLFDGPEDGIIDEAIEGDKGGEKWKVLVVDDEEDIHLVTRLALKGFSYLGKEIEFLGTFSGKESREVLQKHPDIAVILLDVVMETNTAGLELVKYIRDKLKYRYTQIVLRTGHPGYAPEREVIVTYEINDYKTKTELTSFKLFTLVLSSLRAYDAITRLEALRSGLEEKVKERTAELDQNS
jgi:CheY-like chemotaxis protein